MPASKNALAHPACSRQSAGLTITIPEGCDKEEGADMHYPPEAVQVRNTFIHVASPAAPQGAYRAALSCPASHVGMIQRTLKDLQDDFKPAGGKPVICLEDALCVDADAWAVDPIANIEASWHYPAKVQQLPMTMVPLGPVPGTPELPSVGSSGHSAGDCKPCSFLYSAQGCRNGAACLFCHLCGRSEKKRRQKLMRAMLNKC